MIFIKEYELEPLDTFEIQLFTLQKLCEKYEYAVKEIFNEFYIKTKYESWKIQPTENNKGKIKVFHGNEPGNCPSNYHLQFREHISLDDLIRYINEHERSKYKGEKILFSIHPGR